MQSKPKIVIVGSGFGGVYTYINLHKKFHRKKNAPLITIVSEQNYFLFTPLLHEVATGSVNQANIAQPIRQIFDSCPHEFIVAKATMVDAKNKKLITDKSSIDFDFLVLATGSKTNLRGFNKNLVFGLKDLEDARKLKNHIIGCFEQASGLHEPALRKRLLNFVVLGAGPTGVELAAEISQFACKTLSKSFAEIPRHEVKITLVQKSGNILPQYHQNIRQEAAKTLSEKQGITILLNQAVEEITALGVKLKDGQLIETATPILTAGVMPNPIEFSPTVKLSENGRIVVNQYLQLPEYSNIFAIGDVAAAVSFGKQITQSAQAAEASAKTAAKNIMSLLENKPLTIFTYKEQGQLVSLGRGLAAAEIFGINLFGRFAWWVWRTIYASKLIGWGNRIRVVLDWTIDIFYPRDISKI